MFNQFANVAETVDGGVVNHMNGEYWLGAGGFMVLWMIVLVAVIALIVALAVRNSSSNVSSKDPLDIAKARFAKGEIDKKEFESLKKELSK